MSPQQHGKTSKHNLEFIIIFIVPAKEILDSNVLVSLSQYPGFLYPLLSTFALLGVDPWQHILNKDTRLDKLTISCYTK